jgi:hypothetical protein
MGSGRVHTAAPDENVHFSKLSSHKLPVEIQPTQASQLHRHFCTLKFFQAILGAPDPYFGCIVSGL